MSGRIRVTASRIFTIWETTIGDFRARKMSKIEHHLRELPHKPLHSSDKRYEKLHARYKKYKKRYPDRSPSYYENRRQWML